MAVKRSEGVTFRRLVADWRQLGDGGLLLEQPPDEDEDEEEEDEEGEEEPAEEIEEPEADPEPEPEEEHAETPEDSLDNQIDALLIGFEADSIDEPDSEYESPIPEGRSLRSHFGYLFEQPEDEEDEEDEEGEDVTDNTELQTGEAKDPGRPKLNLDDFAQRVARLYQNHESLLDVPRAILDRTMNFVRNNYDDVTADELEDILAQQHGIELVDVDEEYPEYGPSAVGAEVAPSAGGEGFEAGGELGGAEI